MMCGVKPKEVFDDAVSTSHTSILVGDLAKLLRQNGIDLEPLQKELFTKLARPDYIIMSAETIESIKRKYPTIEPPGMPNGVTYESFCGIPVAICNAVPYGFIDIKD